MKLDNLTVSVLNRQITGIPIYKKESENSLLQILIARASSMVFFCKDFIYLFLERGEGRARREGGKHQSVVAPHTPPHPTRDLVLDPRHVP